MDASGKTSTGVWRTRFKKNAVLPVKTDGLISLSADAELGRQAIVAWLSRLKCPPHALLRVRDFQWHNSSQSTVFCQTFLLCRVYKDAQLEQVALLGTGVEPSIHFYCPHRASTDNGCPPSAAVGPMCEDGLNNLPNCPSFSLSSNRTPDIFWNDKYCESPPFSLGHSRRWWPCHKQWTGIYPAPWKQVMPSRYLFLAGHLA